MRLLAAIAVSFFAMAAGSAQAERRVALVIGHSTYQNVPQLPNPVNDADAVAAMFKKAGFDDVDLRKNLSSIELKRAIREFAATTQDADIAVVFFAGHGFEINGINYLIPVDAKLKTDFDAEDEAVRLDRFLAATEPAKRLRLVILDACRDNPFLATMKRTIATRAVSNGLAQVEPTTKDTLIAYSAKAGSVAEDGKTNNSPFTTALLNNLAVPGLDLRIAFGRVRDEVMTRTANRQEPFVYGSLGGDIVSLVPALPSAIAAKPAPQASPQPVQPSAAPTVNDVRADYELAERVGTKEAWDLFLTRHKSGFYADLARVARAKLEPAVAALPPPTATSPEPTRAAPAAAPDPVELSRQLQSELKRVGCYAGTVDGEWGPNSRRALEAFNQHARSTFDVKVASLDALDIVRGKATRICPIICDAGFKAEGERCVAVAAPPPPAAAGPPVRRAVRDRVQQRFGPPPEADARPSQGGGRVACGKFGCIAVKPNCRVVPGPDLQEAVACN